MILYLGNMLSASAGSVSVIEQLGPKLAEHYEIKCVSSKKRQVYRLYDMLGTVVKNRKNAEAVLIDSYSTLAFWYTVFSSVLCRLNKIPFIVILHGGNYPARLKRSKFWCRQIFNYSSANVVPSEYLLYHFTCAGFNAIYIPNLVDIERYPFMLRSQTRARLLWVRAFHAIYNPFLAVETIVLLKNDFPDIEICMVGADKDGSLEKFMAYAKEKGVSEKIKITGKLSREEWSALSVEFNIFLNTTNVDNTPLSVIEAMALGIPIVSTNAGGLPYLIEDGVDGLLVPAGDAEKMAQAIKKILNDPLLCCSLSKNGRKKAERFRWDAIKYQWYDVIDKAKNLR